MKLRFLSLFLSSMLIGCGLAAAPAGAFAANKASAEAGAVLYRDKGCSYCHGVDGKPGKKGPNLTGLRTDKQWPPEKISAQILNGGQKMPPFADSLTDAEVADLVAYLRAKHRPEAPPTPVAPADPTPAAAPPSH